MLCSFGISTEASAPAVLSLYLEFVVLRTLHHLSLCVQSIAGSQMRVILRWWSSQPNVRVTR